MIRKPSAILFPLLLAGILYGVYGEGDCCFKKELSSGTYNLVEKNSSRTTAFGCNTPGNCVYNLEGTEKQYCFKQGGSEVPKCIQDYECPVAAESCVQRGDVIALAEGSVVVQTWREGGGGSSSCIPNLPKDVGEGVRMATANCELLVCCGASAIDSCYKIDLTNVTASSAWTEISFPHGSKYHSLTSIDNRKLVATGGITPNSDLLKTVNEYNGTAWKKANWSLELGGRDHAEVSDGTHFWVVFRNLTMHVYELSTGNKIKEGIVAGSPDGEPAAVLIKDKIYVGITAKFFSLEHGKENATWQALADLPVGQSQRYTLVHLMSGNPGLIGGPDQATSVFEFKDNAWVKSGTALSESIADRGQAVVYPWW